MQVLFRELLTSLHQQLNDFTLLSFCHNYYPRPDTGLSVDLVNKKMNSFINLIQKHKYMVLL